MRLINYDDLLERLHRVTTIQCTTFMGDVFVKAEPFIEVINNMPIVEPELRKGEWQTHYDVLAGTVEVRCSFCHAKSNIDSNLLMDDGTRVELFKYCPCCGARMDSEKNE